MPDTLFLTTEEKFGNLRFCPEPVLPTERAVSVVRDNFI